jgi:hypothetical protein
MRGTRGSHGPLKVTFALKTFNLSSTRDILF